MLHTLHYSIHAGCIRAVLIALLLLFSQSGCKSDASHSAGLGKISLTAGGESTVVSDSDMPRTVGWKIALGSPSWTEAAKCPDKYCLELRDKNGPTMVKSQFGGAIQFPQKDGKIELVAKNLSGIPLEVEIYQE